MFNRGPFQDLPFNRPVDTSTLFSSSLVAEAGMRSRLVGVFTASAHLSAEGAIDAVFVRSISFESSLGAEGGQQAEFLRIIPFSGNLSADSTLTADAAHYRVQQLIYSGVLSPGEVIIIDSREKTITLDGQNALKWAEGKFPELYIGENELMYADEGSERELRVRVYRKNKYV